MEITLAILMVLGIFVGIPSLIGFAIAGTYIWSDRRVRRAERTKAVEAATEALTKQPAEAHGRKTMIIMGFIKKIGWKIAFGLSLIPIIYLFGNLIDCLNSMGEIGTEGLRSVSIAFFILLVITTVHLSIAAALGYFAFGRRWLAKAKLALAKEPAPVISPTPATSRTPLTVEDHPTSPSA